MDHKHHEHHNGHERPEEPVEREALDKAVHGRPVDPPAGAEHDGTHDPHTRHSGHSEHAPETLPATGVMADAHPKQTGGMRGGGTSTAHGAMSHSAHGAAGGHEARAGAHVDHTGHEDLFRRRFWVSLILSIPVLIYSPMIQMWLGFTPPAFPGSEWLVPVLSLIVFAYGGVPFLKMALPEIRERRPGMMTLISLAITVALVYSVAVLFTRSGESFFWELVTLIDIMLLGHWIEMRSVRQASGALDALAKLMPDTAERVTGPGQVEEVAVSALRTGDVLLVRPGARVPADGEVVEGDSSVNESMITGESRPVDKTPGARVIAGTVNGDGSLRVRVIATGESTALAGIMRLVREAQTSKSRTQILADRAAGLLFYVALAVAAITAVAWTIATGFNNEVVARVATVLVIACPHALGLAIPLVVAITTALGARNGILVRDRLALERARQIDTVIFDKTGTLTEGEFGVAGMATGNGWTESRALAVALGIEGDSEHTIAAGLRREAEKRGISPVPVTGFEALKGRGVRATVDGMVAHIGGPRLLDELKATIPPNVGRFAGGANARGQTVVYLLYDSVAVAAFALADVVRAEAREAIDRLQGLGISVAMLTGDAQSVAKSIAEELGISEYYAEVLPEHKDEKVLELQRQGRKVAMVGDGVNDAPALARADVGIAIGSGTDVAVQSAGIILVRSNPLDVVKIIELSRASYAKMQQNLLWATGYNVVALPLAAGVLAPWGVLLSPAAGAVLMSVSTIIVALNAQLLRGLKLGR